MLIFNKKRAEIKKRYETPFNLKDLLKAIPFSPSIYSGCYVSSVNPIFRMAEIVDLGDSPYRVYRVFVAKSVDLSKLKKGQPVLIDSSKSLI